MSDYSDILNRKTFRDKFSDALNKQADGIGKPMNKGQADTQAILRGFAVGFGNDREREAKLKEIEEDSRQTAMLTKELTMATGKNQLKKEKYNLFLNENYAGLMQLSDLMQKGEDGKIDILGPELFANFSRIMGEDLGKFQHYKNGYFNFIDKKGEPRTINSMNLLQPLIANLPDDQKQNFKGFLTPLQMKDIDRIYEEKQLKIDKYRAEIDASKASGEASKAHAELYKAQSNPDAIQAEINYKNAQANKLNQEALYVGKDANKELLKKLQTSNIDFLEEAHSDIKSKEKQLGAYKNIGNLITEEFKTTWNRSGAGLISKAQRFLNPSFTDASRRQAQIEMEKEPLYHEIRKIFTGAVSDKDVALFVTTLPDLNNSYEANMDIINKRKNALEEDIFKLKATRDLIQNSDYSTHFTHTSIQDKVEQMNKERLDKIEKEKLKTSGKVKLQLKDGSIKVYDKEKDTEAIKELLDNNLANEIE